MDINTIFQAVLLGLVEGLTEFIPVSSTGHLIVLRDIIGFSSKGQVFEIAIQLGAILAICFKFWPKLSGVAFTLHSQPASRKFALNLLLAFLPAAIIGFFAHGFIKEKLFSTQVVAISLILGGFAILLIENLVRKIKFTDINQMSGATSLKLGFFQCIAMIPGVSRSGATIMGGLLLGLDRKTATEFSFFLAIPTMFAATLYDLYKNWAVLDADSLVIIAIGFVTAFFAALLVVSKLIEFVSTHGFKPFAYYRIAFGTLILLFM